jgi:streptogramin lyase
MHFLRTILSPCSPRDLFNHLRFAFLLAGLSLLILRAAAQSIYSEAYTFTTFAGYPGEGSADGVGTDAQFYFPSGVAVDGSGNVYVADTGNSTIRKITLQGEVSTIAGFAGISGGTDGTNSGARFYYPFGVAIDINGNLYVADTYNNTIRKVTPVGTNWLVTTLAGQAGNSGSTDGTNSDARFSYPESLAVDQTGNVYVADSDNYTIRRVSPIGTNWVVSTIAGLAGYSGSADGTNSAARFGSGIVGFVNNSIGYVSGPEGVAVDTNGNVYVADTGNKNIRKVTPMGTNWVVTTLAVTPGWWTYGVAVDSVGNVYVSDLQGCIEKVTPAGGVTAWAGGGTYTGGVNGTGTNAEFYYPHGVAVDTNGNVYVADVGNNAIRKITSAQVVSTIAGSAHGLLSVDGTGSAARFNQPIGLAVDNVGNLYVGDSANFTIRMINPLAVVSTIAGLPGSYGFADGAGTDALFTIPEGVAADTNGNVYVADLGNNAIRKVTPAGVVTTLAGTGLFPSGVALDSAGNLYVANYFNIQKVTPIGTNWIVTMVAGQFNTLGSSDGTNSDAQFAYPGGVAVDSAGNLYVADTGNNAIRKVTPDGTNWVVTTLAGLAGSSAGSADGVGSAARFSFPSGVAVDSAGNVYVADTHNDTIRKVTPTGVVTTLAGLAGSAGSADGAGSAAHFFFPQGISVDSAGNVYVADSGNNTIRKGVFTQYGTTNPVSFPQPANNAILVVTLSPPAAVQAGAGWRFPWELTWRTNGEAATNLVPTNNYPVEFSPVPGYLAIPALQTTYITNGSNFVTGQYYSTITSVDTNIGGSLEVLFQVNAPRGAGWKLLGDPNTNWHSSGFTTNLLPGDYLIECAALTNFVQIPILSVQISAGLPTVVQEIYQPSQPAPAGFFLPVPVPSDEISDLTNYPYGFNGQLETDVGYGSGVAVQPNVVLTAAHLVFNDQTLSYVSQAWWYPQEEAPQFVPEPQAALGWLVYSGYASSRSNALESGFSPDQYSPQSGNFDVAALYFSNSVAGGGYGGYLPSDATPNTWLTSTANKMLVGYPVDSSMFRVTDVTNGEMYEVGPQPYPLSLATDPGVSDQQVYTASWFLSYPGNSGGPFYVELNGYYYPAGVYLGTLYSGTVPYASAVRAIDSNVVNLITNAQLMAATGSNNSGGGVITIIAGSGISTSTPGGVQIQISPPAAFADGGAWKISTLPDTDYGTNTNPYTLAVTNTNAVQLFFSNISGWNLPTNQSVTVGAGQVLMIQAFYTLAVSWGNPAAITYGTALGSNQLNATTVDRQGNYAYSPSSNTVLDTGTYTLSVIFTPGDTNDYGSATATTNVSLDVEAAPLTVTASNASRAFGQTNPVFGGTITGLENQDNITASYGCSAGSNSAVGTYAIVPALVDPGDRQTNYTVSLVNGTLTVIALPLIQTVQQSGSSFTFTWSATTNQMYQIQSTTNLTQSAWTTLTNSITATNSTMTISEPIGTNAQQFYRVVLLP